MTKLKKAYRTQYHRTFTLLVQVRKGERHLRVSLPRWGVVTRRGPEASSSASRAAYSRTDGPYQHDEKFIPTIIRACLEGQPIPVYGDGSNRRDWLYVNDHCAAIDTVMRHGRLGETYNIGGGDDWKNLDVVYEICQILADLSGASVERFSRLIRFVTDRPGHDWRYAIDATRLQDELHWQPAETFETGMRKTVAWYMTKYTL